MLAPAPKNRTSRSRRASSARSLGQRARPGGWLAGCRSVETERPPGAAAQPRVLAVTDDENDIGVSALLRVGDRTDDSSHDLSTLAARRSASDADERQCEQRASLIERSPSRLVRLKPREASVTNARTASANQAGSSCRRRPARPPNAGCCGEAPPGAWQITRSSSFGGGPSRKPSASIGSRPFHAPHQCLRISPGRPPAPVPAGTNTASQARFLRSPRARSRWPAMTAILPCSPSPGVAAARRSHSLLLPPDRSAARGGSDDDCPLAAGNRAGPARLLHCGSSL